MAQKARRRTGGEDVLQSGQPVQPVVPVRPVPIRQQDLGSLGARTDRMGVAPVLQQGLVVEEKIRVETPEARNTISLADGLIAWSERAKNADFNGRNYSPEAQYIGDMARQAKETLDPNLLQRAQGLSYSFILMAGTQAKLDAQENPNSPDSIRLSQIIQRSRKFFTDPEQHHRTMGTSIAGYMYMENRQVYDNNQEMKQDLFNTMETFSDHSRTLRPEQISAAFATITSSLDHAIIQLENARGNIGALSMNHVQALISIESVREKMKSKMEALDKALKKLTETLSDEKKSSEEKEQELAKVEKEINAFVADAIKIALKDADAPDELIGAIEKAKKFLKKADLRERGQRIILAGMMFLNNRIILDLPENEKLRESFLDAISELADEKKKISIKLRTKLLSIQNRLGEAIMKAAGKPEVMIATITQALDNMKIKASKIGNKYLAQTVDYLKGIVKRIKSPVQLRKIAGLIGYLGSALDSLSKMPGKTKSEKSARNNIASLVANAILISLKEPRSEEAKMARLLAGAYAGFRNGELLLSISRGLKDGSLAIDKAKEKITRLILQEADISIAKIKGVNPDLAKKIGNFFKMLRKNPESTSASIIGRAIDILGLANFASKKVLPHKNKKIRKGVLGVIGDAIDALQKGNHEEFDSSVGVAAALLGMPEHEAEAILDEREQKIEEAEKREELGKYNTFVALEGLLGKFGQMKIADGKLSESISYVRKEIQKIQSKLQNGESVNPGEMKKLEKMIAYVEAAIGILKGRSGWDVKGQEKILGEGAKAFIVSEQLRAMVEILKGPKSPAIEDAARAVLGEGADEKKVKALSEEYKKDNLGGRIRELGGLASLHIYIAKLYDMSHGASDKKKFLDMSSAIAGRRMKAKEALQDLANDYTKEIGRIKVGDPVIKTVLETIKKGLGTPSIRKLEMAQDAIEFAKVIVYEQDMLKMKQYDSIRKTSMDMLRSALFLLQQGAGSENVNSLISLAKMLRENHKDPEMRKLVEGACKNASIGTMLYQMVMATRGKQGTSIEDAAKKVISLLNPGSEISKNEIESLVSLYQNAERAYEKPGGSAVVALESFKETSMFIEIAKRKKAVEIMQSRATGQVEKSIYKPLIGALERALSAAASGEKPKGEDIVLIQRSMIILSGDPGDVRALFITSKDPEIQKGQAEIFTGLENIGQLLKPLRGVLRERTAVICAKAQEELAKGNLSESAVYLSLAKAYARARTPNERKEIQNYITRFSKSFMSDEEILALAEDERPIKSADALWLSQLYRERSEMYSAIGSPSLQRNFLAYSELALKAYQQGDHKGSNLMRNLAVFYARAAVGNVSEVLALADGNKEIPSLKKFRQGIERGQSVAQIIGAKKGEEEKALSEFGLMLCEIDIVIGSATFESRMKNIDSDKAQYKAEAGRLGRLQTTAMQKKNIYEAERLGYHIKLSDIEKTKAWIEKSKLVREEATRLLRLSLSKEKESLDANEKDAAKLLEEAAMLRENGERLLWLAENIQTSALLFHTSITQVGTIHRDRGRHECAAAADKFTAITEELMAAGAMPDATVLARYEIALKSANQNLQMGASQISQQRGIQSSVWGLVQRAEKLTKDNQKFGKEYGKEVKPLTGYPDTRSSKLAYDQKAIQKKIDGGRSLAISERIGAAGAALGNAGFQMNSSVLAAVICKKHWNLIKYASETEKKYGMLEFSTGGWLAIIEKGQKFADQGRMAAAEEQMSFVKYEFVQVQSWKQNLHNTFNSNITLWSNGRADARMHARKLADRHYDITTEREASGIDEAPAGPQPMKTLYRTMRAKNRQRYVKAVEKAWRDWEKSFTDRGRFPSPEAEEKFRASIDQLPEIKKIVERNEKVEKKFWEGNLWQSDLSDSTIQFDHALMTSAPNTTKKDWHRYYSEVEASNKAHSTWKGNAQDANEQANKAKGRAVELHWIKQRTQTTQDVPDANPALNQMLAMAVVANDVMVQEIIKAGQRGEDHLPKGLGEITPEMKKRAFNYDVDPALAKLAFDALILRQRARNNPGKGETLLKQAEAKELQVAVALGNDPKKMDIIATHLMQKGVRTRIGIIGASSDKISEVLARNLFYMAKHRDGTLKFQQHESGRRIATDAVNMFIQTHNARYNLKRARPHGFDARVARRQLELAAGSFLGMARTASSDTAYAHYQASQGELIEQMEKAYIMYGEAFAGLATPGGVKPEAVTEEMGTAFQLMREYPSVAEVAKLNVRLMHATWGIHIDPETGETSKLHMSPKEQMALISALDSANGALEQMLGIASSLRTFMSTGAGDEGHDALLELEKHIAKVEEQIGIIIDHAAARDPEDVMEYGITDEMKEKDLNEITGKIKSHRNAAWKKVEGLIETGVAWDTAVMIGETLVKTVAYSALACSGYGTAAGAAGLAETYVGMEELVASRGGLDQMKTRELWTYYGSYALAGAGFAIGGLSDSMRIARGLSSPAIGTIGAEIPGTSRLLPRALDRTMSVLSSGTVEKATNVGGLLLMGGGIGIGGLEVYNMYKDGATSAAQYGLAFWNALNPALAIGGSKVMSLNPKLAHSRSLGATAYRGMMGALFGISQGEMVAAHKTQVQQQYYAMRKSRVAGIRGRNRQETRKAQAQQWTMDEGAFTAIEKRHGPLTTEERMAVLEHYSSGEGGPRQINPDEAVTLLGKYNALVESRMGELHPDARTRIEQIPDLIGRQLENGEILAIIQEFGHEIPGTARTEIVGGKPVTKVKVDVGRIMQFLDGKRITAAQIGTKPFYTLTDYAAFYDKASAGLEPPAAVAKPKDTGGTLFRLDAAARARDYKKTRDIMLGMTIAGYSDEHVAFAREVAIAADYFANYNEVPPGTPTEVAQAAEKLAGKKGTKSNFRDASNHGNAQTQLKLALGATNQIFAKQATQSDSVIELGLHTPEGVAKFARKIVRMDSDALETLEGLPYEIQKAVKGLAADPRFGMAARASDSEQTIAKLAGPGGKLNEAAQKAAKKIEPELPLSQEASEIPVLKAAGDGLTPVIGEEIATQPKTKSDQTKAMKISIAGGGKVQIPVPETPATISGETVGAQPEVPLRLVKPVGKIAATTKVTDEGIQIISYGGVAKDGEIPELLVIKTGNRALVINSNYVLGKHGTGSGSAGSKLGTISNADELLAFVRQHVNLEELKEKGVTVIPNVSAGKGQKTSTDTLVKIVNVRMDGEEVPVGTELKKGVDYVAVVQDADGTEFEAPLRMVLTREEPETWMPQIFTDRKAPDTDQINIIVGRVDLDDSRAAWVNPPALVEKIGEDTEVFAIYTAFPGGYAPAANPPLSLNHDPIVGMRGTEFWNVHALMNKPPRETDMVSGAQLAAFVGELLSGKADVRKAAQGQLEKMPLAIQAEVNGFIHKIRETEASGKRVSLQLAISMAEPYAQKIKDVIITEESALAIVLSDREAAAASKAAPSEEITVPVPVVEEASPMPRRKRITELAALAHDSVYGDAAQKAKAAGQIESLDAGEQKVYAKFENLAKRTKERGEDFSPEHYSRAYWEQNAEPEELAAQTKADAKIVSKLVDTYNKINQMESKSIGHGFHTSREYRRMLKYIADGNTPQQAAEMVVTEYRNHEIQFSMERKARSERPSIPTETVPLATYEGAIGERVGRADLEKVLVGVDERTRRIARVLDYFRKAFGESSVPPELLHAHRATRDSDNPAIIVEQAMRFVQGLPAVVDAPAKRVPIDLGAYKGMAMNPGSKAIEGVLSGYADPQIKEVARVLEYIRDGMLTEGKVPDGVPKEIVAEYVALRQRITSEGRFALGPRDLVGQAISFVMRKRGEADEGKPIPLVRRKAEQPQAAVQEQEPEAPKIPPLPPIPKLQEEAPPQSAPVAADGFEIDYGTYKHVSEGAGSQELEDSLSTITDSNVIGVARVVEKMNGTQIEYITPAGVPADLVAGFRKMVLDKWNEGTHFLKPEHFIEFAKEYVARKRSEAAAPQESQPIPLTKKLPPESEEITAVIPSEDMKTQRRVRAPQEEVMEVDIGEVEVIGQEAPSSQLAEEDQTATAVISQQEAFDPAVAVDSQSAKGEPKLLSEPKYIDGVLTIEAKGLGGVIGHVVRLEHTKSAISGNFTIAKHAIKPHGLWLSWGSGWDQFVEHEGLFFKAQIKFKAELKSGLKLFLLKDGNAYDSMMAEFSKDVKLVRLSAEGGYPEGSWWDGRDTYYEKSPWQWLKEKGYDGVAVTESGVSATNDYMKWDAASIVIFEPEGQVRLPEGEAKVKEYNQSAQSRIDKLIPAIRDRVGVLYQGDAYQMIIAYEKDTLPNLRLSDYDECEAFLKTIKNEGLSLEDAAERIIKYYEEEYGEDSVSEITPAPSEETIPVAEPTVRVQEPAEPPVSTETLFQKSKVHLEQTGARPRDIRNVIRVKNHHENSPITEKALDNALFMFTEKSADGSRKLDKAIESGTDVAQYMPDNKHLDVYAYYDPESQKIVGVSEFHPNDTASALRNNKDLMIVKFKVSIESGKIVAVTQAPNARLVMAENESPAQVQALKGLIGLQITKQKGQAPEQVFAEGNQPISAIELNVKLDAAESEETISPSQVKYIRKQRAFRENEAKKDQTNRQKVLDEKGSLRMSHYMTVPFTDKAVDNALTIFGHTSSVDGQQKKTIQIALENSGWKDQGIGTVDVYFDPRTERVVAVVADKTNIDLDTGAPVGVPEHIAEDTILSRVEFTIGPTGKIITIRESPNIPDAMMISDPEGAVFYSLGALKGMQVVDVEAPGGSSRGSRKKPGPSSVGDEPTKAPTDRPTVAPKVSHADEPTVSPALAPEDKPTAPPTVAPVDMAATAQDAPKVAVEGGAALAIEPAETPEKQLTRRERQKQKFQSRPLRQSSIVRKLTREWTLNEGKGSKPFQIEIAFVMSLPEDVRQRIRDKTIAKIKDMAGDSKAESFSQMFDILINIEGSPFSPEYKPVLELDPEVYQDPGNGQTVYPGKDAVMQRGTDELLHAQGIEVGKGGLENLLNIMLEGEVRYGDFGGLSEEGGLQSMLAGGHGPYYVVVDRSVAAAPAHEDLHIAYIVPTDAHKKKVVSALNQAVELGLMSRDEAVGIMSKVATYDEFTSAPKGIFEKPGDFAASQKAQADDMIAGAPEQKPPPRAPLSVRDGEITIEANILRQKAASQAGAALRSEISAEALQKGITYEQALVERARKNILERKAARRTGKSEFEQVVQVETTAEGKVIRFTRSDGTEAVMSEQKFETVRTLVLETEKALSEGSVADNPREDVKALGNNAKFNDAVQDGNRNAQVDMALGQLELPGRSREIHDVAQLFISKEPEKIKEAHARFQKLSDPEKDSVNAMVSDGSRYLDSGSEQRMAMARQYDLENSRRSAGIPREVPSKKRLTELAQAAWHMLYGNKSAARKFLDAQELSVADEKAYGRLYQLMKLQAMEGPEKISISDYVNSYSVEQADAAVHDVATGYMNYIKAKEEKGGIAIQDFSEEVQLMAKRIDENELPASGPERDKYLYKKAEQVRIDIANMKSLISSYDQSPETRPKTYGMKMMDEYVKQGNTLMDAAENVLVDLSRIDFLVSTYEQGPDARPKTPIMDFMDSQVQAGKSINDAAKLTLAGIKAAEAAQTATYAAPEPHVPMSPAAFDRKLQSANLHPDIQDSILARQSQRRMSEGGLDNCITLFSGNLAAAVQDGKGYINAPRPRLPKGEEHNIPVSAYVDSTGRIVAVIDSWSGIKDGSSSVPAEIRNNRNLSVITLSIDSESGKIENIFWQVAYETNLRSQTKAQQHALTDMIGLKIIKPQEPSGGGPEGPESGTIPIAPETVAMDSVAQVISDSPEAGIESTIPAEPETVAIDEATVPVAEKAEPESPVKGKIDDEPTTLQMAADSDTLKDDQTLEAEVLTEPVKVAKKPKEPQVIVEGEEEKGTLPGIGPEADQDIGYDPTEPDVAVQDVPLAEQETQDHYEPTVISPGVDSSKASGKKPQTAESLLSVAESVSRLRNVDVETRKLEVSRLDIDESAVRAVLGVLEYESGDPRAKAIADEWEQSQIAALKQRRLSGAREAETVKAIDEIFGNSEYWEGEGQGNPTVETIISALGTEEKFPVSPLLGKRTESKKHRDALKAIYLADGAKGVMKYLNDNGFETRELQKLFMLDKYIKSTISEAPTRIAEAYQEEGVLGVFGELVGLGTLSDKKMLRETSQLAEGNMGFVEVVIRGDLLGKIRSVPGYENVKIGKIKKIPGGVGRYRIILSDGRELFSQIENYYPARLGALLFEAQGLMKTSDRYHAFSYGTGVVDQATQHEEKVMFGFTRDMHDFAKASEKVKIRMPDTDSMEEVTVAGVALKNDLMFSDLKDPAIVSELEARGSLEPVKAFRKMLKTEKGRAEIMRAWAAYHEMSRRAIGVDRFLRNTAIVLVKRDNPKPGQSEYVITFQPFDADFIGGGIVGKGDSLNFHGFDKDFAAASVKFVKELHFSAMRENIMISQKKLAIELLRAHEACDLSILPETRELSRIILHEHKDKTFGFPISEGIGSVPNYAGRKRVVVSPDGRMILNRPEELSGIQDSVTTPENHKEHSKRRRVQFVKEEGFMIKRADIQGLGPLK